MAKKFIKKEITPEIVSTFIEGYDPQERIVNFEYNYRDDFVKVYYRDENDNKRVEKEPFYPFLWATKRACMRMCNQDRNELIQLMNKYHVTVKALDVTNTNGEVVEEILDGYTYMFKAIRPMSYTKFLEFFKAAGNSVYSKKKDENPDVKPSFTEVPEAKKDKKQYLVVTPIEQFMISTGKRMFKGYDDYDQTLRLIFDLETTGLNTKIDRIEQFGVRFNRPVKLNGEYIDFERIFTVTGETEEEKNASELENIINFLRVIYTFKPDIITAHNGETFDWNMIFGACQRLGTTIEEISKPFFKGDSIYKNKRETILKLGGEIETFNQTIVPGTTVTDSLHAVRRAQALDSNMLFSNLKYITKYSKIVKANRVYVPGDRISEIWNDNTKRYAFNNEDGDWYIYDVNHVTPEIKPDPNKNITYFNRLIDEDMILRSVSGDTACKYPEGITANELYETYLEDIKYQNINNVTKKGKTDDKFTLYTKNVVLDGYELVTGKYIVERYLLDDLWECDKVEHRYNTSNFLICKMLPVPFQKCCTMGTAGQWKSLMLAWSYENNLAIPPFGESKSFTGGLSRLLKVGFVDDVAKFDYNSLYPSIILTWGISDPKDLMNTMLAFLEHVLTQREKFKGLMKTAGKKADAIKEKLNNREYNTPEEGKQLNQEMLHWESEKAFNDKKQLPTKILANSFFGSYGAPNVFPWGSIDCAERTTCTGRMSLRLMIYMFNKWGYKPIVGDSFTGDTPLFIKYKDTGYIDIKPIEELINESEINIDELGREYDYSTKPYYVLCRSGWMEPSYIYRHKTDKPIYQVTEGNMSIDVTEDHSLFNDKQKKIKPSEINENTKLEYFNDTELLYNVSDTLRIGKYDIPNIIKCINNGSLTRIPCIIFNMGKGIMGEFYREFMLNYKEDIAYNKTIIAGLQYIKKMLSK